MDSSARIPHYPIASMESSPLFFTQQGIFDLPFDVRDQVYRHNLHDGASQNASEEWRNWSYCISPDIPNEQLGLLRASRGVYEETSTVLYQTVYLGSNAQAAWKYLLFIGPSRRRQIRYLTIYYECRGKCRLKDSQRNQHIWVPVFELLRISQASLRQVDVYFKSCGQGWCNGDMDIRYLDTVCCLEWQEEADHFWRGLRTLTMVQEIRFKNVVPEYFAHVHARESGWRLQGKVVENEWVTTDYLKGFIGKIVNPAYTTEIGYATSPAEGRNQPNNHKKRAFLDLPIDIRLEIYDRACDEWVYKPFWPVHPMRWNSGIGLLSTCKRIATEARQSVYRTFRIYGGSPLGALIRLGPDIAHIRRLEIYFSCFCPWGGTCLQLNNNTIFAKEAGREALQVNFKLSDWRPGPEVLQQYTDMWTEAMNLVQAQKGIIQLDVTFLSCCRSPWAMSNWPRPVSRHYRSCCLGLENHFLDLLEGCRRVEKLSLAGNVPPSFAVRMEQVSWGFGQSMRVVKVSPSMDSFIKGVELEWETRDQTPGPLPWHKTVPYPHIKSTSMDSITHFVLVRQNTARNRWARLVGLEGEERTEKKMERVVGPFSGRSWESLRALLDYDNTVK